MSGERKDYKVSVREVIRQKREGCQGSVRLRGYMSEICAVCSTSFECVNAITEIPVEGCQAKFSGIAQGKCFNEDIPCACRSECEPIRNIKNGRMVEIGEAIEEITREVNKVVERVILDRFGKE